MYRIGICDDNAGMCSELEKMIETYAGKNHLQPVDFLLKPLDYEKIDDVLTFWNRLNRSAEIRSGKRFFRIPMTIFYICIAITRLSMWLWRTERNAFMKR